MLVGAWAALPAARSRSGALARFLVLILSAQGFLVAMHEARGPAHVHADGVSHAQPERHHHLSGEGAIEVDQPLAVQAAKGKLVPDSLTGAASSVVAPAAARAAGTPAAPAASPTPKTPERPPTALPA